MLGLDHLTVAQALEAIRTIATTDPGDADAISFDPMRSPPSRSTRPTRSLDIRYRASPKLVRCSSAQDRDRARQRGVAGADEDALSDSARLDDRSGDPLLYAGTMLAEKFEAIVSLGTGTSRFKDFYDVRELSRKVPFAGAAVAVAFRATFSQRGTKLPTVVPESLLSGFAQTGETGWKHFLKKLATTDAQSFAEMVAEIEPFVRKISAMARGDESEVDWMPGRGWSSPAPGHSLNHAELKGQMALDAAKVLVLVGARGFG